MGFVIMEQSGSSTSASEPSVLELLQELRDQYVSSLVDKIEEIELNILSLNSSSKFSEALRQIHSMKGTSGNMGFLEYSALCAQLEFAITKEDCEEIGVLLTLLDAMKKRIVAGVPAEELH